MLLCIWSSISNGDDFQNSALSHVDLCCFHYYFSVAWFATRCKSFRKASDIEHQFPERMFPLPTFVPWHRIEIFSMSCQHMVRVYLSVKDVEWKGLITRSALHVPTSSVFSYYFKSIFEKDFRRIIFTVARGKFAVSAAIQFLQVPTESVCDKLWVDDRVRVEMHLVVALRASVISRIYFTNIKKCSTIASFA